MRDTTRGRSRSAGIVVRAALLLAPAGAACDGGTDGTPGGSAVTLGRPADDGSFAPLEGDVVLVPGSQGGFHVWITYRIAGMPPGRLTVRHSAARVRDGRLVVRGEREIEILDPGPGGVWEPPRPLSAFMCPTPIGVGVDGERLRFRVEVDDGSGLLPAAAEAEATPRCPDGDQRPFCERICRG